MVRVLVIFLLLPATLLADGFWLETLMPADGDAGDEFGRAVGIHGDCILVGAPGWDATSSDRGAVYSFVRTGDNWGEGKRLQIRDGRGLGFVVGMASTRAVVGSEYSSYAVVLRFEEGAWHEEHVLPGSGPTPDGFGRAVAISNGRLLIGAPFSNISGHDRGLARVYESGQTFWPYGDLWPENHSDNDHFGSVVAMDGDLALVAGITRASVHAFYRQAEYNWVHADELGMPLQSQYRFGSSLAIRGDLVAIGAKAAVGSGGVVLFAPGAGMEWQRGETILPPDPPAGQEFGAALVLTDSWLAVGAPQDGIAGIDAGAVYLYEREGQSVTYVCKVLPPDSLVGGRFGDSIAINDKWLLVGAPGDQNGQSDTPGAAHLFNLAALPVLQVSDTSVVEGSNGWREMSLTISLDKIPDMTGSVNYRLSGTSGVTNGVDVELADGSVGFDVGQTSAVIPFRVNGDRADDGPMSFGLSLTAAVNVRLSTDSVTVTIVDDDPLPAVQIGDVSVAEGNEGAMWMSIPYTVVGSSTRDMSFWYATRPGSAGCEDFVEGLGAVYITEPAGELRVAILGDAISEPDETFEVVLFDAENLVLPKQPANCTIIDDDAWPEVAIDSSASALWEGGAAATITVSLSEVSGHSVVAHLECSGTAVPGVDYLLGATSLTIPVGMTCTSVLLEPLADAFYEVEESVRITLAGVEFANLGESQSVSLSIADTNANRLLAYRLRGNGNRLGNDSERLIGDGYVVADIDRGLLSCLTSWDRGITWARSDWDPWTGVLLNIDGTFSRSVEALHILADDSMIAGTSISGRLGRRELVLGEGIAMVVPTMLRVGHHAVLRNSHLTEWRMRGRLDRRLSEALQGQKIEHADAVDWLIAELGLNMEGGQGTAAEIEDPVISQGLVVYSVVERQMVEGGSQRSWLRRSGYLVLDMATGEAGTLLFWWERQGRTRRLYYSRAIWPGDSLFTVVNQGRRDLAMALSVHLDSENRHAELRNLRGFIAPRGIRIRDLGTVNVAALIVGGRVKLDGNSAADLVETTLTRGRFDQRATVAAREARMGIEQVLIMLADDLPQDAVIVTE